MRADRRLVAGFLLEFAASIFTLAGMFAGSTTVQGASFYLISLVFWFWLMFHKKLWGLLPLNVGSTIVCLISLGRAL